MSEKFDINEESYVSSQLDCIENMLMSRNYALLNGLNVNLTGNRHRRITRDQIRRAIDNPFDEMETLQQASEMLSVTNGIYQEVLNYQAHILTDDYMLIPVNVGKVKTQEKMMKLLEEQANFISKYNIKYNAKWMRHRVLKNGELFIYKVEASDSNILQEMPNVFCKIVAKENDVHRFAIDLSKMNDNIIVFMPKEIQVAYKKYKNGVKTLKLIDRTWYQVGSNGVAFTLFENKPKSIPYYTSIFDDLIELEDKKDLKSHNDVIDAIKLIHQKLPYDKDTGQLLINTKQATAIHNATKQNLPKGTAIVTHHLDTEVLTLSDSNSKLDNSIKQATDSAYDSAGISAELFNGKKNSNEAIASGIVVDSMIPKRLQKMFENWLNFELSQNKKLGVQFKIRFMDTTEFNKDSKIKLSRENMAYGGSRLEFLATNGYEPTEGLNLLKMEGLLGMDKVMIPQQSAHTLSKSDAKSSTDNGRPSKEKGDEGGQSSQPEQE